MTACQYCGDPMTSTAARSDRRYCGATCRLRAFRQRERERREAAFELLDAARTADLAALQAAADHAERVGMWQPATAA